MIEASVYSEAVKIPYIDYEEAYFFWSSARPGGQFFRTRSELEKYCLEQNLVYPRWVWGCTPTRLKLDARSVILERFQAAEHYIEEEDVVLLQEALDNWSADRPLNTFEVDYNVAVILDSALIAPTFKTEESE